MANDESSQIEFESTVQSSGPMPFDKVFRNKPAFFPNLNHSLLKEQAELWALRFPMITRITLHAGENDDPPYVLVVEIGNAERQELLKFMSTWQPDSLRSLVQRRYRDAFRQPATAFDEWMIEVHQTGEEVIMVFQDKCWLLFKRPSTESSPQTRNQRMWDNVITEATELLRKYPEMTSMELAESDEVNRCFGGKVPSIETIIKHLRGKVPVKKGRPKRG